VSANGATFKRGLDAEFMTELEILAKRPSWFADVLDDPELVLGIRDNYLNVYWRGCSLFKIERNGKTLTSSTHPKYLIRPELSKAVAFDGGKFDVNGINPLTETYEVSETLDRMKRAARVYAGDEKTGVHAVIRNAENNVVDTEVTFDREDNASQSTQRVDIANFEEGESSTRLLFWEAKLFTNKELWAKGENDPPVIEQVTRYRDKLQQHRDEVLQSYRKVAENLVEIGRWNGEIRKPGKLVEEVANGAPLVLDETPFVGLVVFEFDAAQRDNDRWRKNRDKLSKKLPLMAAGDPKHLRLNSARALRSRAAEA